MRTLKRNQKVIYYANQSSSTEITDEYGNKTGTYTYTYSTPIAIECNIQSPNGDISREFTGLNEAYTRVLIMESCPLTITSRLWIGESSSNNHNYEVVAIRESLNHTSVAVREVD